MEMSPRQLDVEPRVPGRGQDEPYTSVNEGCLKPKVGGDCPRRECSKRMGKAKGQSPGTVNIYNSGSREGIGGGDGKGAAILLNHARTEV